MSLKKALSGVGYSAAQAGEIAGAGTQTISAAGTTQATATVISDQSNAVSVTGANSGVVLSSTFGVGDEVYIYNGGANTLQIYPNGTDKIDNVAGATGISLLTLKGASLIMAAPNVWLSHKSA